MWTALINMLGGSILGVAGGWVNKWLDMKAEAQRHQNEVALKRVDAEIMAQEWAARTKVAEVEVAGKIGVAEAEAFGEAVRSEAARYSEGVKPNAAQGWLLIGLDVLRGAVRPSLTIYLCIVTTLLYYKATTLLPVTMDSTWAAELVREITFKILFLTDVAVGFWFGARPVRGK